MFTAAMIDAAPAQAAVSFWRSWVSPMSSRWRWRRNITENKNTVAQLAALTEQNAFVKRLPDGKTYRFHHMMKACAERSFATMKPAPAAALPGSAMARGMRRRSGISTRSPFYRRAGDYDALLRVVEHDAGILLASLRPSDVLETLGECPLPVLKAHPLAILVLMRSMFNWRMIPKMLELKALLLTAIEEHPGWSPEERGNLLGECDLITSFLMYNDISAMSRLHRSASAQMSRPAISIRTDGGWTFGSPSVLMMFHREPGDLARELRRDGRVHAALL